MVEEIVGIDKFEESCLESELRRGGLVSRAKTHMLNPRPPYLDERLGKITDTCKNMQNASRNVVADC